MILEKGALEKLRSIIGDSDDNLFELVDSFLEEAPVLLQNLMAGMQSHDLTAIKRAAHSLKSSARDFGATELAAVCARIESTAQGALPETFDIDGARAAWDVVAQNLRSIRVAGLR